MGCLTLFTLSDNAIDITVHPANKETVFEKLRVYLKRLKLLKLKYKANNPIIPTSTRYAFFVGILGYYRINTLTRFCRKAFLANANFGRPQLLFFFVKVYCFHSQENDSIARFCTLEPLNFSMNGN